MYLSVATSGWQNARELQDERWDDEGNQAKNMKRREMPANSGRKGEVDIPALLRETGDGIEEAVGVNVPFVAGQDLALEVEVYVVVMTVMFCTMGVVVATARGARSRRLAEVEEGVPVLEVS
jgi:hypothetical protein